MVKSLENLGIVPLQFRLDSHRPDLTKVDTLLGLLASECSFFPVQVDAVAQALRRSECRLAAALEQMKDLPFPDQPLGKQGGEKRRRRRARASRRPRRTTTSRQRISCAPSPRSS